MLCSATLHHECARLVRRPSQQRLIQYVDHRLRGEAPKTPPSLLRILLCCICLSDEEVPELPSKEVVDKV